MVETLKKEERAGGKGRRWRSALRRTQAQLADLEHDGAALELVFPQARVRTCRHMHAPAGSTSCIDLHKLSTSASSMAKA